MTDGKSERVENLPAAKSGGEVGVGEVQKAVVIDTPYSVNPELTKHKAKELYLLHRWTITDLLELGIPKATLETWVYQPTHESLSWKQERDIFDESVLARMKDKAADAMTETFSRGMNILSRSYLNADMENLRLTKPREFKDMIDALTKLKNLINLEEGKPNEIKQYLGLNQSQVDELVKRLDKMDPFINYEGK